MNRAVRLIGSVAAALSLGAGYAIAQSPDYQKSGIRFLDQNWSQDDRSVYYYTSQGSAALRYDIFLNLEQPENQALFRADENLTRYGFVPGPADPRYNPDALPIGIAKAHVAEGRWKGEWAGLTCAACHNGQLEYKGVSIRIAAGNNAKLDLHAFVEGLDDALQAATNDPAKFDRMATRLGRTTAADRERLRQQLQDDADSVHIYRTRTALTPTMVGPGRVDALALIHNQVMANQLGLPENWRAAMAPVKYSFAWNLPQSAWAQWSGTLPDPVLRNGGEAIGVFVKSDFRSPSVSQGLFESTIDFSGQIRLEELLRKVAPPPWPEDVLGPIDRAKATAGKQLFVRNCAECHSTWPHRWSEPRAEGRRFIENAIVAESVIGTDPTQFGSPQFGANPAFRTGALGQFLPGPQQGAALAPAGDLFGVLRTVFFTKKLDELNLPPAERLSAHGFGPFFPDPQPPAPAVPAYKANPADGMWANPPYLHNGSVPNLYELLLPASQRSKQFYLGREFDPVRVGIDTSGKSGRFLFDTAVLGNSNAGHSFEDGSGKGIIGRLFSDDERWAIVEYLKSIPDGPAQVTPFGGPSNPVRAWLDLNFYHLRHPGTYVAAPTLLPSPAPGQETVAPGEAQLIDTVRAVSLDRLHQQFPPGTRPVLRDAHPKTHGVVIGEFIVLDNLPAELRYGVFKTPRRFDAIMRFSAGGVEAKPDTVPQAAGLAIKLLGVEGEKLLPSEKDAQTQDFIMINFPTFFIRNMKDYEALHQALSVNDLDSFFRYRRPEAEAAAAIRGQALYNPLAAAYFSQTPYRLGPNAMKFSVRPISAVSNTPPGDSGPDFMREEMARQLAAGDVYLEFLVQLQTDPATMPIEDALERWDEIRAPFRRVALIRIPRQQSDTPARIALGETLAFTPWHSLPEHRPLGDINRSRLSIYDAISEFRRSSNGAPSIEPTKLPD